MLAHVRGRGRIVSVTPVISGLAGACAAAVLGVGLVLALTGRFGEAVGLPAAEAAVPASPTEYRIVALGDSISAGTGDARAGGYPGRLARMLRERGRPASVVNLAVPGAESGDVLERAGAPDVRGQIAAANLIVVSAGANDLSHSIRPELGAVPVETEVAAARARENLKALVARLRQINGRAPIRLVGIYNPFEVEASDAPAARAQLLVWNDLIEEAAAGERDVLAIPVADLFAGRPDRLAGDHYHPGARGHELIAARVLQTLPEGDARPSTDD
jgi:lysophospholipase L1-like esterase